jgi:membrane-associated protein
MTLFGLDWRAILALVIVAAIGGAGLLAFREIDLEHLVTTVGYPGLALIVFAETGLLIGFFLPGDTLLLTAGLICERGFLKVGDTDGIFFVIPVIAISAIIGDAVGYQIGRRAGPTLYSRPDSRWFKREHLEKAQEFYDRHGGKTIILARFLAFVRTFAPTVAGAANMNYPKFAFYNVTGGILWALSMCLIGYFVGKAVPNIEVFFTALIVGMVGLSVAPAAWGFWRQRRAARRAAMAAGNEG